MSLWLDADELVELTGYRQREKQRQALAELGVQFRSRPADGFPLVPRAQFEVSKGRRGREPGESVSLPTDLTLDQLRALPTEGSGAAVYFLWKGDELKYVGSSANVSERLYWHHSACRYRSAKYRVIVDHDRATVLKAAKDDVKAVESAYLQRFQPPDNKVYE